MDAQDWTDLASVYRAGAGCARGWSHNTDRQQEADILEAQADRCDEIARTRRGNPAVTHEHDHYHTDPADDAHRVRHRHSHSHASGSTDHDPAARMTGAGGQLVPAHEHTEYGPGRDPFAPLPRLA